MYKLMPILKTGIFYPKRSFATKQFHVTPFCNINVDCNLNLTIQPLNIYKYPNCDKILVDIDDKIALDYSQCEDNITISSKNGDTSTEETCNIIAPVKANFVIKNARNVAISNFNSEEIQITAKESIDIDKCYGEKIVLETENGDIISKNLLQAANITAKSKKGNITTGKLQGLELLLETDSGNITTDSSYCDISTFIVHNGNISLNNAHKNVNVFIKKQGCLNIVGLDGSLKAFVKQGHVNAQISRLLEDSNLTVAKNSKILLKLAEYCQENVIFDIIAAEWSKDNDLKMKVDQGNGNLNLLPTRQISANENCCKCEINCKNSSIHLSSANWSEMFALKLEEMKKK